MALTNIEYGSMASSDTMNKNFAYLDDRISEVTASMTALISSISSNIATINSRLGDLAEEVVENAKDCSSRLDKTIGIINKSTLMPNWDLCYELSISEMTDQTAAANGYLLLYPKSSAKGDLVVNETKIPLKARSNADDNSAQMFFIPVRAGDKISCTVSLTSAYFLPAEEFSAEEI